MAAIKSKQEYPHPASIFITCLKRTYNICLHFAQWRHNSKQILHKPHVISVHLCFSAMQYIALLLKRSRGVVNR